MKVSNNLLIITKYFINWLFIEAMMEMRGAKMAKTLFTRKNLYKMCSQALFWEVIE